MKCTICGCEKFANIATIVDRPYRICAKCGAMERQRALWRLMSNHIVDNISVLEISPLSKYIFGGYLKESNPTLFYTGVDKYATGNPKDKRDVSFCDYYFDLIEMPKFLEDESYDIVIMQHVLEEIVDYESCFYNIVRVMKRSSIAFLEIPNYNDITEHIRQEPNHYGNVWKFSKSKLHSELQNFFQDVKIVEYNEGGYSGNIFIGKKQ